MSEPRKPNRRDIAQDIAYLKTMGEWFTHTLEVASLAEPLARQHGFRLLEIAQRLRNACAIDGRKSDRDTPSNQEGSNDEQQGQA
jgi:hypothetical protein